MKRTISTILVFLCIIGLLSGCQNNSDTDIKNRDVSKFASYIEKGEYANAIKQYNEKIQGNYELESETESYLESYYEAIVQGVYDNTLDEPTAKTKKGTVDKVLDGINMGIDRNTLGSAIDEALASKVAFSSGNTFFDSKNYKDAITEYSKVSENDVDYQVAQQKLEESKSAFKKAVIEEADKLASENKSREAISKINEAISVIPDDSDLLTKLTVYGKNHVNEAIKQAETAFNNDLDYTIALEIIKRAQQQFPDDSDLKAKEEYYTLFVPISIFTFKPYSTDYEIPRMEQIEDNMGNTYEKVFYSNPWNCSEVYDIGKKYNKLSGVVAVPPETSNDLKGSIKIIGDGKILWEKNNLNGSFKPQEISVDITGVTDLRIEMKGDSYITASVKPLFADVTLQRTEK